MRRLICALSAFLLLAPAAPACDYGCRSYGGYGGVTFSLPFTVTQRIPVISYVEQQRTFSLPLQFNLPQYDSPQQYSAPGSGYAGGFELPSYAAGLPAFSLQSYDDYSGYLLALAL